MRSSDQLERGRSSRRPSTRSHRRHSASLPRARRLYARAPAGMRDREPAARLERHARRDHPALERRARARGAARVAGEPAPRRRQPHASLPRGAHARLRRVRRHGSPLAGAARRGADPRRPARAEGPLRHRQRRDAGPGLARRRPRRPRRAGPRQLDGDRARLGGGRRRRQGARSRGRGARRRGGGHLQRPADPRRRPREADVRARRARRRDRRGPRAATAERRGASRA